MPDSIAERKIRVIPATVKEVARLGATKAAAQYGGEHL